MPEPIFDSTDRVASVELPAEIRNETDPKKIAAYYQRREGALRDELRRATPPPQTRVTVERPTDDAVRNQPPAVLTVGEAQAARSTLIATAEQTAKVGKKYWSRLEADIKRQMAGMGPEEQINSQVWEVCYNTLVGMNIDRLQREDTEAAATASRIATERASAPPTSEAPPAPLPVEVTAKILPGLNLSEEQYRTAQDNINKGVWPLTKDNISGQRTTIGSR
jgi:hypothetical protein